MNRILCVVAIVVCTVVSACGDSDSGSAADPNGDSTSADSAVQDTAPEDTAADNIESDDGTLGDPEVIEAIEAWLLDAGDDAPEVARCVAEEMSNHSVADFEANLTGSATEGFEVELEIAYDWCEDFAGAASN